MLVDHACAAGTHTHAAANVATIATAARAHTYGTLAVTTASLTPRRRTTDPLRPAANRHMATPVLDRARYWVRRNKPLAQPHRLTRQRARSRSHASARPLTPATPQTQ